MIAPLPVHDSHDLRKPFVTEICNLWRLRGLLGLFVTHGAAVAIGTPAEVVQARRSWSN